MKKLLLLAFLLPFGIILGQSKDPRLKGIEKELNKVLEEQHAAGFAVAVVKGDKIIYSQGFGYRDLDNKLPVTENTLFAIGSASKAFTAALLGQLEGEKKLKLDDLATIHLPQLKFQDNDLNTKVTIRDMMCHRTGLPRYDFSWYFFNSPSKDSLLTRLQYMKPTAELRETWQYNNYMFLAQGMITEQITGTSWENNISSQFFKPLNMTSSNTTLTEFKASKNVSLPYGLDEKDNIQKLEYFDIAGMAPAGSINSSVTDMAAWVSTWINGGMYQGKEIIPADYIKQAISSQMVIEGKLPEDYSDMYFSNYGLGWMLHSYRGHYQVEHGGNIDGFSSNVCFYPSDSIGIIVLTNQDGSAVPKIVRNILSDRLLKLPSKDWSGIVKQKQDEAKKAAEAITQEGDKNLVKGTNPSHKTESYLGSYYNPAYGTIEITQDGTDLKAILGKFNLKLDHYHYDYFTGTITNGPSPGKDSGLKFNFHTGLDGSIESISSEFDQTGTVIFGRKIKPVVLSSSELDKYVGDYDLMGTIVKVSVKDNILYVFVPGQTDYETLSMGNNTFNLTIAKGYSVVFEVDQSNKVLSLSFVQPNGTFKAVRK